LLNRGVQRNALELSTTGSQSCDGMAAPQCTE
jgi:hypothetical protein